MIWSDKGFLLSKLAFQENSIIANFFTKNHGKCSGIIYGATSKKIKNYLQNGNELFLEYSSKNENALGYFKVEIINPHSTKFFSERKKLNCIVSMLELVKILTVDGQENIKIYQLIKDLFDLLNKNDWIIKYVFWELDLLKFIGFDLNIKNFCKKKIINEKKVYFVENSFKKIIVPNFLVEKCDLEKISNKDIYNSLYLIGEYMKKNIFVPNNVNYPISRQNFINYFK
tara:strand:- start:341 stop:1024 length:684 start_codon:yes stop_codon:yes gene_type:complete